MPASKNKKTDGGDSVAKAEVLDNEEDSPIVSRTRSGRRLHTPAVKTPVRRTRKSAVREDPVESTESRKESPPDERPADTKGDQCSQVTETVCPDVSTSTSTSADVSQEPVPDTTDLIGSDQTSEKENVVNNTETESTGPTDPKKKARKRTHSESSEKKSQMIPLGKPKSGRVWKDRNKQRFSALLRDKPLRTSWGKKMEAKREKQLVKQYQQQLKDKQIREKEEKKRRREEHLKRKAENERKAEIVQVIKNTAKIKRMKKKTLRKIEKRDTLSMVQKTPPSVKKGSGKTNSSL